ncbi:MAG TPA: tripartite tricarboxylate transporter substrate binding protein [Burkholderiales bacterium]|nr:tripartite tricarboxylate transporter substrate binding protein [Burkholderiales bacterium]
MITKRLALFAVLCAIGADAFAQPFPSKPIRIIVPSSAGGSADTITRVLADGATRVLGQRVLVDNRPGASGNIGSELAAKSPPDGYTWLMINNAQAANVSLYKTLTYDLLRDFAPVTQVEASPHVVVVHPSLPVKSIADLVKLAKAQPGKLDYASAGLGTVTFLAAEIFKSDAGVNLVHVPYKGGGESLMSIVGGETIVYFSPLPVALPHMSSGRLRALAVTSKARVPRVPHIPTVAESGYPRYEFNLWDGLLVPVKTPRETITAIHSAVLATLKTPEVSKRLTDMSSTPIGNQPEQFGAFLISEVDSIAKLVKRLNLTADAIK